MKIENKRTSRFEIRISPEDKEKLRRKAWDKGQSMADYVHDCAIRELMETGHG